MFYITYIYTHLYIHIYIYIHIYVYTFTHKLIKSVSYELLQIRHNCIDWKIHKAFCHDVLPAPKPPVYHWLNKGASHPQKKVSDPTLIGIRFSFLFHLFLGTGPQVVQGSFSAHPNGPNGVNGARRPPGMRRDSHIAWRLQYEPWSILTIWLMVIPSIIRILIMVIINPYEPLDD